LGSEYPRNRGGGKRGGYERKKKNNDTPTPPPPFDALLSSSTSRGEREGGRKKTEKGDVRQTPDIPAADLLGDRGTSKGRGKGKKFEERRRREGGEGSSGLAITPHETGERTTEESSLFFGWDSEKRDERRRGEVRRDQPLPSLSPGDFLQIEGEKRVNGKGSS